ncbi:hypothetical protein KIN20_006686 [Parelaphostrongylus tenuis]|uniref:Uncharacterized protein n=1 Tax=Parelaphostrongylus tenuis TaxID=148309 RepID=A0AAD5QH36_PARTN|nr:hypothetical protein KIN20_006686 [Parelaphostrongylus tenuis]
MKFYVTASNTDVEEETQMSYPYDNKNKLRLEEKYGGVDFKERKHILLGRPPKQWTGMFGKPTAYIDVIDGLQHSEETKLTSLFPTTDHYHGQRVRDKETKENHDGVDTSTEDLP